MVMMRSLAAMALMILLPLAAMSGENLVPNGHFEGGFTAQGTAQGWADNSSWANLDVTYAAETVNPHSGKQCQRVTCTRLVDGAVQIIPTAWVPLAKGKIYCVTAWLRGDVGRVAVQLRQAPAPYRIYIEGGGEVAREWRKVEYLWTSTEDDEHARLMLRFTQTGTLWIDDVSVEELTIDEARASVPPPTKGNLLLNGGFDLDTANWMLAHHCDDWREPTMRVEEEVPGQPVLRLQVPEGIGFTLESDAVRIAPGFPIAISARMRSSAPTKVTMSTRHCGAQAQVGATWTTLTASGEAAFEPSSSDNVMIAGHGPVTLWIDDVTLRQEGATSPPAPRPEVALISTRHPLSLFHDGETPKLRMLTYVSGKAVMPADWHIEDFWGKRVLWGRAWAKPGRDEQIIEGEGLPRGWYHATVTWTDAGVERHNESTFCLLPPMERKGDVKLSPFGAHFSVDPTGLALAKAVGCRWLRLHPPNFTKMRTVEPAQGQWAWQDEPIKIARAAGLSIVGSLDRLPRWASSAPEGTPDYYYEGMAAWMPKDWADWEKYVAETVKHHRADIHLWEVWNEPNLTGWLIPHKGQTQAQGYVELLQHTYPIVKREDPKATVIGGVVAGALTEKSDAAAFASEVIKLGGLKLMDIFSFHDYINAPVDEGPDPLAAWIARLRAEMKAAGRELPIINSEGGFANPGTSITYRPSPPDVVPPDKMARYMVRQYIAQWAQGIDRFFFYNFFVDGSPSASAWEGFVEGDGQPRPNVAAYAMMSWILDGATFEKTEQPSPNVWMHRFMTPRGPVVVAWAKTGAEAEVHAVRCANAWDMMGAPIDVPEDGWFRITDAPVYLLLQKK